jgi:hypothetical protein
LLVSWCAGGRCGMACSDEDRGRSRRPGAEDWGWSHRLGTRWPGGREVGWRRVRSAPSTWKLGARDSWLSSKPRSTVCEWFGLKTTRTVFASLASKLVATVFPGLASKPVVGFLVEPQTQGGGEFSGLDLKTSSTGLVIWASKSSRQFLDLVLKTKWASVCRLRHKTDGGRSARDTRRDLAACLASKQVWLGFLSLA